MPRENYTVGGCNKNLAMYVFINDSIFIGKYYWSVRRNWLNSWMYLFLENPNVKVPANYKMGTLTFVVGLEYYHERLLTYRQGKAFSLCGWIFDSI